MKKIIFSIILLSLSVCVSPVKAINIQTISTQQSGNINKTSAFKIGEEYGRTVQIRMNSDSLNKTNNPDQANTHKNVGEGLDYLFLSQKSISSHEISDNF